VFEATLETC